ncbi:MAG: DUF4232 domain-containing protein [Candidatus Limnocylindrales bacterium]
MTTSDDEIREMLSARAARADGVRVGPILDRALRAPAAGSTGPRWWRAALGLGGVAAAGVALAIAAVWFAGGPQLGPSASNAAVGASIAATPTTPPASSAPSHAPASPAYPSPSQGAAVVPSPSRSADCSAADLTARILDWQGAAGSRIADIELASRDGASCIVQGRPQVLLLDAHGATLIDSAKSGSGPAHVAPTDPRFVVSPGHPLKTQIAASNYCGPSPALPLTVALVLPNGGHEPLVATALTTGGEAEAVPPCNGQGSPATISTNGWSR